MNKRLLLFTSLFLLIVTTLFSQINNKELIQLRDKNFGAYKTFKDTITVRTWLNMVELSKRLEAVVEVDNVLIDSLLKQKTVKHVPAQSESTRYLNLKKTNKELNREYAIVSGRIDYYKGSSKLYGIGFALTGLALLIILISYFLYVRKIKEVIKQNKTHHKTVLKLKQSHQAEVLSFKSELDTCKMEVEKLNEEKIMLENSATEIKKSFEVVKSKQETLVEKEESKAEIQTTNEDELADIRQELTALSTEVGNIINEKQLLEDKLTKATEELDKQKNVNSSIEGDIEGLLNKLKGKDEGSA
jgi:DNA repair exonuclease SbcCD ATPase subunit